MDDGHKRRIMVRAAASRAATHRYDRFEPAGAQTIAAISHSVLFTGLVLAILTCSGAVVAGESPEQPFVVVLGIAQDAGFPQAGCQKACCAPAWSDPTRRRFATCLAVVDPIARQRWLVDCTPDFREQLRLLDNVASVNSRRSLDGILLTHAHIGHYSGLIHLGREVMGAGEVPVYAMPRMREFLRGNGPWSQLVQLKNISLRELDNGVEVSLNERVRVTPIQVPHRDEFSETVAFRITGPTRSVLYLPDIDKWDRWQTPVEEVLRTVDVAWVDGTFFANGEIPGRDMSLIPHPFIQESLHRFRTLPAEHRARIRFIHLNHTNPALDPESAAARLIHQAGCRLAVQGERVEL